MSKPKQKVFSYIRFSTPDQGNRKSKTGKESKYRRSLDRQLKRTNEWCAKNGYTLEESSYRDLGVSAFKGDNATEGKLGAFIEAVDSGAVPKGSILVMESLDRLSRQQVHHALELFLGILRRGIVIVTLDPEDRFELDKLDDMQLIIAIIILSRAYNESSTKSNRIKDAWDAKRANIHEKPLSKLGPGWLRLEGKIWKQIPEKVAIVRDIFDKAEKDWGVFRIVRYLNENNIPSLRNKTWQSSSVLKILHNRSVHGEFQPRLGRGGTSLAKRPVAGDAIPNYYPEIISKDRFDAVQKKISGRAKKGGRQGKNVTNLFDKLLYWNTTQHKMVITNKGQGPSLVCSAAARGVEGIVYISFSYSVFEKAFLGLISNLDPASVFPSINPEGKAFELEEAKTSYAALLHRIDTLNRQMEADSDFEVLLPTIKRLVQQRKQVEERIETINAEITTERAKTLKTASGMLGRLSRLKGQELIDARLRLRAMIFEIVDQIDVEILPDGIERTLIATVRFNGGTTRQFFCKKVVRFTGGGASNPIPQISYLATADNGGALMVSDVTVLVR
jgi:DNA invertase Pin-like site-specific DNA recombinase